MAVVRREAPQTVVVTGANRGIGLSIVGHLLARGDRVVATARQPERSTELQALSPPDGRLTIVPLDVADSGSIARAAAEVGDRVTAIDVLINNAGIIDAGGGAFARKTASQQLGQLEADPWLEVLRVNTVGPALVAQALLPLLRAAGGAKIVNISSKLGSLTQRDPGVGNGNYYYDVSKTGQNMVTRLLAADLQPDGIAVASLVPGWVRTAMGGDGATLDVDETAAELVAVVDRLDLGTTGAYLDRLGQVHPW